MYSAGADGEAFARRYLTAKKWIWVEIDQNPETFVEELKSLGGKRADFVAEIGDELVVLLDAKYHSTDGCKVFSLTEEELKKYRIATDYLQRILIRDEVPPRVVETWFMVFPKECDGQRVVWIELSELESGKEASLGNEAAKSVSLEGRDQWWAENPPDAM
jgi:hypothetical protein